MESCFKIQLRQDYMRENRKPHSIMEQQLQTMCNGFSRGTKTVDPKHDQNHKTVRHCVINASFYIR